MFRRVLNFFKGARAAGGQAEAGQAFKIKYSNFKEVLDSNSELLQLITEMEEKLRGDVVFGLSFVRSQSSRLVFHAERMVRGYDQLSGRRYPILKKVMSGLRERINAVTERKREHASCGDIRQYAEISKDMVDCVGGKNANLGEIKSKAKLPIPSGFAITTDAFRAFIEANECMDEIRRFKRELDANDTETIVRASEDIQRLFIMAQVPEALSAEIEAAYEAMCREAGRDEVPVALRSSAIGEDSELSFAGQYLTVLNVPRSKILDAYKQVLASLFTPRALSYRLHQGVPVDDIAMSVACLEMVSSKASGVMYTRHPFRLLEDNIMVNAVWGLGAYAVDGVVTPDVYVFSKDDPPRLLRKDISTKNVRLVDKAGGVVEEEAVEPALQQRPCLTDEQAQVLAGYGLALERHFGSPQDIEWALDAEDRLILLQARPLRTEPGAAEAGQDDLDLVPGYEVVLKGQGVAYPGVGFGRVFHVRQDQDLTRFPEGAVLVAEHASPKYGLVLPKAKALLTDSGSVTGHMASLAREYRVPSILNTATASRDLRQDEEITVDAYSGRVYRGRVEELARLVRERGALMKGTPVYDTLRELADLVVPLNLMDPKSEAFTPANC
ncbi:MAG: PEP/pyruvate-binding domain-containing protein, partial [Desulfovibrionaceae bacterium]|nr:PEP/pyruvate-binding domain-containing protein [Desulfovibrionaceae bacterium]